MTKDEFLDLKADVEELKANASKAEGRLSALLEKAKDEFDCDGLEQLETLLDEVCMEETKTETRLKKEWKKFNNEFGELLDDNHDKS